MGLAGAAGSIVTLVTYLGYLFNPADIVLMSPLVHLFVFIDSVLGGKDPRTAGTRLAPTFGLDVSGYGFSPIWLRTGLALLALHQNMSLDTSAFVSGYGFSH